MDLIELEGKTIKRVTQGDGATSDPGSFWELTMEFTDGTVLKLNPWMYCADNCIIDTEITKR